ncbi:MAG: hypothetical protein PHS82_04120 [Lachnospiraceae bacterium]|nr:hypothetical protein [Lachnospiraceae bacterium]
MPAKPGMPSTHLPHTRLAAQACPGWWILAVTRAAASAGVRLETAGFLRIGEPYFSGKNGCTTSVFEGH